MKIKIFAETYPADAEAAINQWLEANPEVEIANVSQTQVYSDAKDGMPLTISLFYREAKVEASRKGFA